MANMSVLTSASKHYRWTLWRKGVCALLFCLLIFLLHPLPALAHAQYDHSDPAANATLPSGQPPAQVKVWFTERIEPAFSKLEVYNKARQRVDAGDSHMIPTDDSGLMVSLRSQLPDGGYTVVFRNVSRDDGHAVVGSFSFVVGNMPQPPPDNALLQQLQTSGDNFNVWSVAIRWLNYLGMAGLVGALTFLLLVLRPAQVRLAADPLIKSDRELLRVRSERAIQAIVVGSLALLLVGWVAFTFYQASVASDSSIWQAFGNGTVRSLLFESHFGSIWLPRLGLIALGVVLWLFWRYGVHEGGISYLLPVYLFLLGIGVMTTTSLDSHAAANHDPGLWIMFDVLHLSATGFWIGGLLAFVLILPATLHILLPGTGDRTRFFAALIPHFSRVALASVICLSVTGILEAGSHVSGDGWLSAPAWWQLLTSPYGIALEIKVGLFVILIGLGAFALRRVSPRMRRYAADPSKETGAASFAAGSLQRTFRRSILIEVGIGVLLLLVVGGLTSLSPPTQASTRTGNALLQQGQVGDLSYRLAVTPGTIGSNAFELSMTDANGKPVTKTNAVLLRFTMLDMEMGVQELVLQPVAGKPGLYSSTDSILSMGGDWQIAILVRRPGMDDVRTSFKIVVHV
ncbi:copper resistance protein CopC [Ktedonobacter racemifer DSM 44963]|uniref:Copper resistance protein CopC n=2 Tax=Ktedonobacter racemifer TaxID=363277 RepID=D6TLB8_KTERA|nr:copper resistance protein CopC [Ktedonobacter racemifer DSM 44963]